MRSATPFRPLDEKNVIVNSWLIDLTDSTATTSLDCKPIESFRCVLAGVSVNSSILFHGGDTPEREMFVTANTATMYALPPRLCL